MPEELDTSPDHLVLRSTLPGLDIHAAFDYWTVPALLQSWWPPEAEVEPSRGGRYHFSWPAQGWHLRGTFTAFQPAERLAYTWRWDHDPEDSETVVDIRFAALPSGDTSITLIHGPYPDSDAGRERRQDHLDGWMYFLGRLEELISRDSTATSDPVT
jgi:uncharacterized protein YndB with AHSA1/START domain